MGIYSEPGSSLGTEVMKGMKTKIPAVMKLLVKKKQKAQNKQKQCNVLTENT